MADQDQHASPTFRGTIFMTNSKIILAFFLIVLAALLFIFFAILLFNAGGKLDSGTVALLSGFVTTFVLMAKSASDYQFSSSAGSDKKDDAQTAVSKALAEKVPSPPGAPITPATTQPWWPKLTDAEKNDISAKQDTDPRVRTIVMAMTSGSAAPDDLAYLVANNLLTQDRATAIAAA